VRIASQRSDHVAFWLAALVVVVAMLALFREILLPFVAGIVLAYFLNPLADALERRGMGRGLAASLVVGLLVAALVLALVIGVPLVAGQVKQLIVALPGEIERLKGVIETFAKERLGNSFPNLQGALDRAFADLQGSMSASPGSILSTLWSRGLAVVNVLSLLLVTPLVVFYLLIDWHSMLARVKTWLPRDHEATIVQIADDMNHSVAAFIRGQGAICLVLAVVYAVGLSLAGLNYGLIVGLATGIASFIPVVGWTLGLVSALGLALAQFGFALAPLAGVLAAMLAGQALETAFLSPRLVGERIGLHPVWLIFALVAFSYLFGFVGTLIAVPLAAAVAVLVRHGLKVYLASAVYRGNAGGPPGMPP
jgi:predicted PurR-regulated permease PerM